MSETEITLEHISDKSEISPLYPEDPTNTKMCIKHDSVLTLFGNDTGIAGVAIKVGTTDKLNTIDVTFVDGKMFRFVFHR